MLQNKLKQNILLSCSIYFNLLHTKPRCRHEMSEPWRMNDELLPQHTV